MRHKLLFLMAVFITTFSLNVSAEVKITDAWVRATAPGQAVGAAYMTLTSPQAASLFYAETERAGSVEIHSMTMNNGVMKMRQMDTLEIKPNVAVKLAPGGFHLMLFDLKTALKVGEKVTFTLCFKDSKGEITHQDVSLLVREAK